MPDRDEPERGDQNDQDGPHRTPQGRAGDDDVSDEPSGTPQGRTDDEQDDEEGER